MSQLEGHFYRNGRRNVNEADDLIYKCISVKYRLINHNLAEKIMLKYIWCIFLL